MKHGRYSTRHWRVIKAMKHIHGPYCATTRSINSASTEYMMKSEERETAWPSGSTVMPGTSAGAVCRDSADHVVRGRR